MKNNKFVMLLIIFSISGILNAQVNSSQTSEAPIMEISPDTLRTENQKSPIKAFVLSLVGGVTILPGLGQHYNGEHKKGYLMGAAWYSGMIILISTLSRDTETTGQIIGFPLVYGSLLWSSIDAPISAKRINRRSKQKYGHMIEFSNEFFIVGVNLNIDNKTFGPVITVYF